MNQIKIWVLGARPKTLFAAISPIIAASYYTIYLDQFNLNLTLLALLVALALQIAVNYANDYSDGIRGTDEDRIGPIRLVGQKLASAKSVKRAAFISFGIAALAGLIITVSIGEYWILLVGLSAIFSAWFYTGGSRPYGYLGLGEVFVFVYFGIVATMGTIYIQTKILDVASFILGSAMGSFAVAILLTNNLRDAKKDAQVGKRTLAVLLGDAKTRFLILIMLLKPFFNLGVYLYLFDNSVWPALFALLWLIQPMALILKGVTGKPLVRVLVKTGQAQFLFSLLLLFSLFF